MLKTAFAGTLNDNLANVFTGECRQTLSCVCSDGLTEIGIQSGPGDFRLKRMVFKLGLQQQQVRIDCIRQQQGCASIEWWGGMDGCSGLRRGFQRTVPSPVMFCHHTMCGHSTDSAKLACELKEPSCWNNAPWPVVTPTMLAVLH